MSEPTDKPEPKNVADPPEGIEAFVAAQRKALEEEGERVRAVIASFPPKARRQIIK